MDAYIKTIINGLKTWVTSCLSRLESSVSGSLATMADKLTSLSSKVQQAQNTANQAQTTADNAKTTANQAKTTATNAKTTATDAQITATNAQTTANQAKTTADNAQTTANQAKTTANQAQTTAYSTLTKQGMFYLGYNVAASGQTLCPNVDAVYSGTSQGDFFVWIANFISKDTKNLQVSSVKAGDAVYASFGKLVTINQGDIIRIRKGASDSVWQAELVGINLSYEALDTAYTEGVNSL